MVEAVYVGPRVLAKPNRASVKQHKRNGRAIAGGSDRTNRCSHLLLDLILQSTRHCVALHV